MLNLNCYFVNIWYTIWNVASLQKVRGKNMEDEQEKSKDYYKETIIALTKRCDDIELLDLIVRLLKKKE